MSSIITGGLGSPLVVTGGLGGVLVEDILCVEITDEPVTDVSLIAESCGTVNTHDLGDAIRARATFRDSDTNALVDPTTVAFRIQDPDLSVTEFVFGVDDEVVQESVGKYKIIVNATMAGLWKVRAFSTGTGQGSRTIAFNVRQEYQEA